MMTEKDQEQLDELKLNVRRLLERMQNRDAELAKLKSESEQLEAQLDKLNIEHQLLQKRYENLKVAKALEGVVTGNQEARQKINSIVREIDKCLALLNR
jgi:phage shock protein A